MRTAASVQFLVGTPSTWGKESMARRRRAPLKDGRKVTLILTRVEASRLLGVLKHAESMLRLVDPKATQSFLGKLIKRAGKAVGTKRK
jgi:hypothetical protein